MKLDVVIGDITRRHVDAIVNAANPALARGSGVCGAVFAAAGSGLAEACDALGGCAIGDAKATSGFGLAARWIIHTPGPVWHGGVCGEAALLASCYRRSLEVADDIGARSVAFPAISTGIYGYPLEAATRVAVDTVRATVTQVDKVRFVCFDAATAAVYHDALDNG